jgi:hypothetical protein
VALKVSKADLRAPPLDSFQPIGVQMATVQTGKAYDRELEMNWESEARGKAFRRVSARIASPTKRLFLCVPAVQAAFQATVRLAADRPQPKLTRPPRRAISSQLGRCVRSMWQANQ